MPPRRRVGRGWSRRGAWFGNGSRWEVFSNARGLGALARIVLDATTGAVLDKGYIPR